MARHGDGSVVVAWCPNCEWYFEASEIGQLCASPDCHFHLRKRRGYIDEDSEEETIYWTKRALREAREVNNGH